jgi:hypothetical protein
MGLFCLSATDPALAQQTTTATDDLGFQLNNATTEGGACQLTFVITNKTGVTIEESWYNVAFADNDGKVSTVTLKFQPLPSGKPRVQQFALTGQPCETLAGLFINSVTKCTGTDGSELTVCDEKYAESSRIGIEFPWQP